MADKFVLDTDKAQEMSRRLASAAQASGRGSPKPSISSGSLGTGPAESSLSEFYSIAGAFEQDLSQSVKGSSDAFSMTGKDVTTIDGALAQEAKGI